MPGHPIHDLSFWGRIWIFENDAFFYYILERLKSSARITVCNVDNCVIDLDSGWCLRDIVVFFWWELGNTCSPHLLCIQAFRLGPCERPKTIIPNSLSLLCMTRVKLHFYGTLKGENPICLFVACPLLYFEFSFIFESPLRLHIS